jgi:LCP family protein required for cell wall assembly
MNRTVVSVAIGGLLALCVLSLAGAAALVAASGWLAAPPVFVRVPTATLELTHPAPPRPTAQATPLPTASPAATLAPLPTTAGRCGGPEAMTIALLGVDARDGGFRARTDAITLVRVNFVNPSAALLSIPRDLYVPLPGLAEYGIEQSRINTAFVYGEMYGVPGGGPAEFKQTVELNFGLRVDRYALVNFGSFVQGVDALGGIDVDVPVAVYDDRFPTDDDTGTEVFEVPAGLVHMDGATALRYVRTRHQDDDYHRLGRQQDVLLALRDRLTQPDVLPQVPGLLAALASAGRTDLSPAELTALLCLAPQIDRSAIESMPIDASLVLPWITPGGGWVSIPNRDLIAPLVQEFLATGQAEAQ